MTERIKSVCNEGLAHIFVFGAGLRSAGPVDSLTWKPRRVNTVPRPSGELGDCSFAEARLIKPCGVAQRPAGEVALLDTLRV